TRCRRCAAIFPYTTLFRSVHERLDPAAVLRRVRQGGLLPAPDSVVGEVQIERPRFGTYANLSHGPARHWPSECRRRMQPWPRVRSEEHTSELQSRENLVCR